MTSAIRRLAESDLERVVALSLAAWAPIFDGFENEMGSEVYRLVYPDWRDLQAEAVKGVCRSQDNDVWVGVVDGEVVGFVAASVVDEGTARAGEIDMVAVDPAAQRSGIGTWLTRHAIDEMTAQGVDLAVVSTGGDPGHAAARAMYEKLGFTPTHQVRYYRAPRT